MIKKMFKAFLGTTLVLALATSSLAAEKYPDRPIDFICTWGVGGGADQMARTIGKLAEKALGVALPVSNIPGSSGNSGMSNLLSAKADGYTVATYIADTLGTVPAGTARHKITDFEWIVRTQVAQSYLFVKPDSPFKTIQDLLNYAKENPGKLKVAATGFGTVDDISVRYLASKGYKMTTIPIPQPGERYANALGGHSEVLYEQAGDMKQYLEAKQLRPLIIFSTKRLAAFPDVPCSKELGFDITLPQFRSIVAKKGVPAERIKILADAFKKAMETPEWKKFAEEQYLDPESYMGPGEFPKWIAGEVETMHQFMKTFGMVK
ncbi:MAG: tripartite tricarboxylate transporter substrate binding protein [Deltaproteobacteria bacterium]|nr:tripartite tricarboxylate transporter substrate binding protein [Deltaproteobacteria bacterium]